jgi:hypothetical protein
VKEQDAQHLVADTSWRWFELTVAEIVGVPLVDRALAWVLRQPRVVVGLSAAFGLALTLTSLLPLLSSHHSLERTPRNTSSSAVSATVRASGDEGERAERDVLAIVAAFNQASISAGLRGQPELLAPYLASDGTAWGEVQAEYARRQGRGETSEASLVRWGVLHIVIQGDRAMVETQEQWDVIASVGPTVVSSRRGVLVRNRYELRHTPTAPWQIVAVETTPVIG